MSYVSVNSHPLPQADVTPHFTVRLAHSAQDLQAAQALRYHVFYEELSAIPDALTRMRKLDCDSYDAICDHLLVVQSHSPSRLSPFKVRDGEVVGTYRLLRQQVAEAAHGFYSAQSFELSPLLAQHANLRFLELGRSCVLQACRSKAVIDRLWQAIWDYVREHRMDVMFGCASLTGANPAQHRQTLRFFQQNFASPPAWQVSARSKLECHPCTDELIDAKSVLRQLPPLLKGYLSLGCYVGADAVPDTQFNTLDILVLLPIARINPKFFARFGAPAPISD